MLKKPRHLYKNSSQVLKYPPQIVTFIFPSWLAPYLSEISELSALVKRFLRSMVKKMLYVSESTRRPYFFEHCELMLQNHKKSLTITTKYIADIYLLAQCVILYFPCDEGTEDPLWSNCLHQNINLFVLRHTRTPDIANWTLGLVKCGQLFRLNIIGHS